MKREREICMCRYLNMLLKRISSIIVLLYVLFISDIFVYADTGKIVDITTDTNIIYKKESRIEVNIEYSDISLYNNLCYLSYHILDENGNSIEYENTRELIELDETGKGVVILNISIADSDIKECIIELDIVDEKNQYWYLDNENILVKSTEIKCKFYGIDRIIDLLLIEIEDSPLIFAVNVLVFIIFLTILYKWRKKQNG